MLKLIAGIREHTSGRVSWDGRDLLEEGDLDPHEIGYVPQFGIAYELLTVAENLQAALRLRVAGLDAEAAAARIAQVLGDVGIEEIAGRPVRQLSGGQRRRLALALEIVSSPHLLLCDEVTSGLDPKAEDEIVKLMHQLSRSGDRIVLNVTHSPRHLALHDSVLVLYQGALVYHGAPDTLYHYFGVETAEELFPRLTTRKPDEWHASWLKYRPIYYAASGLAPELPDRVDPSFLPVALDEEVDHPESSSESESGFARTEPEDVSPAKAASPEEPARARDAPPSRGATVTMPSAAAQFAVLFTRRCRLFTRDRGHLTLHLALLFGFPLLVIIFALHGLPQLPNPGGADRQNFLAQIMADAATRKQFVDAGTLVSGLVMFQVILLALMGSNNGAREIAAERLIFEKEKFAGLRPGAYILSKAVFLGLLVCAQSIWMTLFVHWFVRFPGNLAGQTIVLILVNGAMTAVCLGLSSFLKTPEQASLVSIYLVGFQLPLSGSLLALPAGLGMITRPFIASYWSWSGFLDTMRETRFFDAVRLVTQTALSPHGLCVWILLTHILVGLLVAYTGCKSSRWD